MYVDDTMDALREATVAPGGATSSHRLRSPFVWFVHSCQFHSCAVIKGLQHPSVPSSTQNGAFI